MSCFAESFAGPNLPSCGVDNSTLRWDLALQEFQCSPLVRITEAGDIEVDGDADVAGDLDLDGNAYLGATDESEHVLRGITSVIGDPNDQLLTVFGHAMAEYLNVVREFKVWGGQYGSYYGYGVGGDQYHGVPYWGSYADDAIGPWHGTGSSIDVRGARFDGAILLEQGFWIVRQDTGMYYWLQPQVDDAGVLTWDILGPWPFEPHAGP